MGRLAFALFFLVGLPSAAFAEIKICNNFEHPIFIALAYQADGVWKSEGWLKVESDACRVDGDIPAVSSFYYRGETDWIELGGGKQSQWTWGNQKKFRVTDDSFNFDAADSQGDSARFEEFSGPVELGDPSDEVTLSFIENVTNITIHHPDSNNGGDTGGGNDNSGGGNGGGSGSGGGDDSGG